LQDSSFKNYVVVGLLIGLGLAIAGISIGVGQYKARTADRYVTVKGLAEREVDADLAIWPITFKVTDNTLGAIHQQIEKKRKVIKQFLQDAGFEESQISFSAPKIKDLEAERYGNQVIPFRYVAQSTVTTRSTDVHLVKKTMEKSGVLVSSGIVFGEENWQTPTEFLFTALNKIKPEMIEEATQNARQAAEKFALDSGSDVGNIRNAYQGLFTIEERDRNSPERKIVRVVTTIQYYLD
jgi:uncharacterized protein